MKIHEYQGKEIFKSYGIPIQDGHIFEKIEDAQSTINKVQEEFNTEAVIVKAQIHAGGRGKAGGVKILENLAKKNKVLLFVDYPFLFSGSIKYINHRSRRLSLPHLD